MALEKLFGQIVDIARQIKRASSPPPAFASQETAPHARVAPAPAPVPTLDLDDDAPVPSDDEVLVTRAGDSALLVSWQLTERGVDRARKVASAPGEIEARLFIITPDRELGSKTLVRERAVGRAGEWLAADLPRNALVTAAVGYQSMGRFVSVAHSGSTPLA